jgi:glyoxylase-like metal-dependent hydrolase (beta-lactamase superfamily II)
VQVVQETKSLLRLAHYGMVNCFLAREDDGFTLDVVGSAPGIREAAQRIGVPICRIVLTQAHIDHVGSVDALAREYPRIEFAVGRRESRLLRKDFSLDAGETGKSLSVSRA